MCVLSGVASTGSDQLRAETDLRTQPCLLVAFFRRNLSFILVVANSLVSQAQNR